MLKVLCVYKSGGDYRPRYVRILRDMVAKHLKAEHEFICLTDVPKEIDFCQTVKLQNNLHGWWSKIELFKIKGPCLYFDLDTVITGSLDKLAKAILGVRLQSDNPRYMFMLEAFRDKDTWASGVMGWVGNLQFVFNDFSFALTRKIKGDQRYIAPKIEEAGVPITAIQKHAEVYSFKKHCRDKKPNKPGIVCFHGRPRPHNVTNGWVPDYWKETEEVVITVSEEVKDGDTE